MTSHADDSETSTYQRGLETLKRIAGARSGGPLQDWQEIAPDMQRYIVEFISGEILSRPGLDLKTRQLLTVTALTAMGKSPVELKQHLHGALNLGWSRTEVVEAIMQMAVFAGFPVALNGLTVANEAFTELDAHPGSQP